MIWNFVNLDIWINYFYFFLFYYWILEMWFILMMGRIGQVDIGIKLDIIIDISVIEKKEKRVIFMIYV